MRTHPPALLFCLCLLRAACGGRDKQREGDAASAADGLPRPEAAARSVTGMPDPGRPLAVPAAPDGGDPALAGDTAVASPGAPATPGPPAPAAPADTEADPDAAVAVLRRYYAAINARDYAAAYEQWSDGGRASGQSPEQFANGFADTAGVSVSIGAPGPVGAAAGSRYVEVPVSLEARKADGSLRRYAGSYTLRLSVVDGASAAQRSWHIASAALREVRIE
jgi:hypothetical protein